MNIIITGASSGIGYELFKILRKKKENNFFLLSRNTKKINKNKKVKIYKIDLKNKKKLKNIVKKIIVHSNKKIDLIICNAAEATFGPVDKIPIEHYEKNFDVNFCSHLWSLLGLEIQQSILLVNLLNIFQDHDSSLTFSLVRKDILHLLV